MEQSQTIDLDDNKATIRFKLGDRTLLADAFVFVGAMQRMGVKEEASFDQVVDAAKSALGADADGLAPERLFSIGLHVSKYMESLGNE